MANDVIYTPQFANDQVFIGQDKEGLQYIAGKSKKRTSEKSVCVCVCQLKH